MCSLFIDCLQQTECEKLVSIQGAADLIEVIGKGQGNCAWSTLSKSIHKPSVLYSVSLVSKVRSVTN